VCVCELACVLCASKSDAWWEMRAINQKLYLAHEWFGKWLTTVTWYCAMMILLHDPVITIGIFYCYFFLSHLAHNHKLQWWEKNWSEKLLKALTISPSDVCDEKILFYAYKAFLHIPSHDPDEFIILGIFFSHIIIFFAPLFYPLFCYLLLLLLLILHTHKHTWMHHMKNDDDEKSVSLDEEKLARTATKR
jgi:hypothetical protein